MVCQIHQHLGGAKSGGWTWPIKIQRLILDKKTSLFNIYDTKKLFVLHLRENTKALLIRRWKTFLRLNQLNIIHTFLRYVRLRIQVYNIQLYTQNEDDFMLAKPAN